MALGGGTWLTQNKKLPGTYINFVSKVRANVNMADRGYAAMPLELDWGIEGEVFTVENTDFQKNSMQIFGYDYSHEKLQPLRDLFKNLKTGYFYRINNGAVKASNDLATAKYGGIRGNDLTISIQKNIDDEEKYDVITYLNEYTNSHNSLVGTAQIAIAHTAQKSNVLTILDKQTISAWENLKDNDYVKFKRSGTLSEKVTANKPLEGGTNGSEISGLQYQEFLEKIEPYYFNILGCVSTEKTIQDLMIQFTKRLRDEVGAKFQCVVYNFLEKIEPYYFNILGCVSTEKTIQDLMIQFTKRLRDEVGAKFQCVVYNYENADYEGVISIKNSVTDEGKSPASLVYWVTGAEASCAVNASCTNKTYDGEYTINTNYKQTELEKAITNGMLMFHRVADNVDGDIVGDVNILRDINTFTSFSKEKNEDFSSNQVIRVLDQHAIDIARLFNKTYLGKEPNDDDGRMALWGDIVAYEKEMQRIRAITNFTSEDVPIPTMGQSKEIVLSEYTIQPVMCMEKLYMNIIVA